MTPRRLRAAAFLVLVGGSIVLPAAGASAHPLGNFTINTYSGLQVANGAIAVEVLVDMAEIPTLQRKGDIDADANGTASPGERAAFAATECPRLLPQLDLRLDERPLPLGLASSDVALAEGQAGLSTLRLTCRVGASTGTLHGHHRISFSNGAFTNRAGWREVTATGDGVTLLASDVPADSISERLTRYPEDLLSSPPDQRSATLVVRPGGPAASAAVSPPARNGPASPLPRQVDAATRAFTSFVSRQDLDLGFLVVAIGASLALGAVHAFAPGHGKTVMAAYLVGQRGSFRQAMVIAGSVTVTHTVGVLALGVAISASAVVAPERVYPWLGAVSGVLLAILGIGFLRRIVRQRGRPAGHGHDHGHAHGGHVHAHGGHVHSHGPGGDEPLVTRRGLLAMGFVGGLLPSPSAVVVLLGAVALGRAWFGVLLVVMYGLGMAATLAGAGLILLHARGAVDRRFGDLSERRMVLLISRLLPAATATLIVVVGCYLAAQGVSSI